MLKFSLQYARSNLQKLYSFPYCELLPTRLGELQAHSPLRRFLKTAQLLCYGVRAKRWKRHVVKFSFWIFCHEMKNPLHRSLLERCRKMTLDVARRALDALEREGLDRELYKEIRTRITTYNRRSCWQSYLLQKYARLIAKDRHQPLTRICQNMLAAGVVPEKPDFGCSGAYLIPHPSGRILAIFKPFDEEIGACHNPSQKIQHLSFGAYSKEMGLFIGTGVHREVAAFLVDQFLELGLVPPTFYAELTHTCFYHPADNQFLQTPKSKYGSLQAFKKDLKHIREFSPHGLMGISLDEIQRLILLDCIIGNLDRNSGNLLTDGEHLIAIDHGLSFAHKHRPYQPSHSHQWAQLHTPFLPRLKVRLLALPCEELVCFLKTHSFLEAIALQRMRERIALLKEASRRDKTVYEILHLMQPKLLNQLLDLHNTLPKRVHELLS